MITGIPTGQICQSFDPRMIKTKAELRGANTNEQPNTSCLAPAYVYVEGKHGKKFLCDYHYYYELYMNKQTYSDPNSSWKNIQDFIIDETEKVKETFAKNVTSTETVGKKCCVTNYITPSSSGCQSDALVKVNVIRYPVGKINFHPEINQKDLSASFFYCNFHYRRNYYRFLSNGIVLEDYHEVIDERYRMTMTLNEESEMLVYM